MQSNRHQQRGVSLAELLIAALLFSLSLIGLLNYQQVLLQGFQRQWQYQQAWWLAHQQLALFDASDKPPSLLVTLPERWQRSIETEQHPNQCWRHTVTITSHRQQIALSRWYCRAGLPAAAVDKVF
ncbi:prepilin-type N-terminal cleavage/methylation domain-containing protein [Serratia microhaemolytica]|uniref:prepilin-type N-terminal cleavage/methylation domain-containing protein n=1 Tax=Serratia microhaemolytica TaxID=2675110 RepID=UPI001F0C9273|nr:prepilin-type N-terminal cleavage/methylation domain-containing protein [Serratia microhaemolytica]